MHLAENSEIYFIFAWKHQLSIVTGNQLRFVSMIRVASCAAYSDAYCDLWEQWNALLFYFIIFLEQFGTIYSMQRILIDTDKCCNKYDFPNRFKKVEKFVWHDFAYLNFGERRLYCIPINGCRKLFHFRLNE